MYDIIIAIDPGINGAVAIMENFSDPEVSVFDTPTLTEIKVKKQKRSYVKHYDKLAMAKLLQPYSGKNVIICIEKVGAMTGQGVTSMFSFGRGVGIWEGLIAAFGFDYEEIIPSVWKKSYGDRLIQQKIFKPEEAKLTKADIAKLNKKEQARVTNIKRDYESRKRASKQNSKDVARELAIELYPKLANSLSRKKDSDRAEALLIAERKRREIHG